MFWVLLPKHHGGWHNAGLHAGGTLVIRENFSLLQLKVFLISESVGQDNNLSKEQFKDKRKDPCLPSVLFHMSKDSWMILIVKKLIIIKR